MLTNELIKKYQFFLNYNHTSIEEMEGVLQCNKRTVMIDIQKVNEMLISLELPTITVQNDFIIAPEISITNLLKYVDIASKNYVFQEERIDMLIFYIIIYSDYISNSHLQDFLRMSKNSILADLKEVRSVLKKYELQLIYSRDKGYYIDGDSNKIRELLEITIGNLITLVCGRNILSYIFNECNLIYEEEIFLNSLKIVSDKYQLIFIAEKIDTVAILMAVFNEYSLKEPYIKSRENFEKIIETPLLRLLMDIEEQFPNLSKERDFILSRLAGCVQGDLNINPEPEIIKIMDEIILQVKVNTGLEFPETFQFRKNLYAHLYPAFYRQMFDVSLKNPLTSQIIEEYNYLFALIKRSLKPLEEATSKKISNDEIAYFTIHFGGYLENIQKESITEKIIAMVICPNGISSSLILRAELKQIFPTIEFYTMSFNDYKKNIGIQQVDMIFSTMNIEVDKPLFIVKTIMNSTEKILLKKKVFETFHLKKEEFISVDEILNIIAKHVLIKNEKELKKDLTKYLFANKEVVLGGDSLKDLVKKELIQQLDKVNDWQTAVRIASKPLLEQGYIEESYVEAIISSVNEIGPYIVLAPKVAVPHASPDAGVHRLGISLLQLKKPVNFGLEDDEDKNVQLIFVLATVDSTAHLKALQQLALILDDDEVIENLIKAEMPEEILGLIEKVIEEGGEWDD
ncbi:BglG family transcription antiterminator [uncultured Granulicatella sp.]|uniref:BglG family transcription antiterminator n=1 Tax=uncultured Granulicatella sp. TaxID=316089 RepID=UPI0028D1695C|nr:BglG family transcription antiterminator [uncultured Granulicatella sp.]